MNRLVAALYDRAMADVEAAGVSQWRRELLGGLSGRVVEIGAGTGRNVAFYPPGVSELVLAEPDRHMRSRLRARVASSGRSARVVDAPAEALPFDDGYFDAAVSTLVLCSVREPGLALSELRRVLRPGGEVVVIEHVRAEAGSRRAAWQRRLEPAWKRLAGNCHLTRDSAGSLEAAGFDVSELRAESMRKAPGVARPTVRGVVRSPLPSGPQ